MDYTEIDRLLLERIQEAAKVMKMADTHSATMRGIQTTLRDNYRMQNPNSDYYGYPYVRDIQGNEESGIVAYAHNGSHYQAKYSRKGDSYTVGDPSPVEVAYIPKKDAAKESDSLLNKDFDSDMVELRESAFGPDSVGEIKLIAPGPGNSADGFYYSEEALKKAAKEGVFPAGTQMFLDHQTESEDRTRPEGSVRNLAAVLTENARWMDTHKDGPGLYARAKAFGDSKDFLNERAKHIGVSIRAFGKAEKTKIGNTEYKLVKEFAGARSVDFVTRAGAGGKLVTMLESFRESKRTERPVAEPQQENNNMDEKEIQKLREQAARAESLEAENATLNAKLEAGPIIAKKFSESKLPAVSQKRGVEAVSGRISNFIESGKLNVSKLEAAIQNEIDSETAYLREAGVTVGTGGVKGLGDTKTAPTDKDPNAPSVIAEAAKNFDADMDRFFGREKKAS